MRQKQKHKYLKLYKFQKEFMQFQNFCNEAAALQQCQQTPIFRFTTISPSPIFEITEVNFK